MSNALIYMGAGSMQAVAQQMSVIGNNLANSGTVGYKTERANFTDQFYQYGPTFENGVHTQLGNGTRVQGTYSSWTGGSLQNTNVQSNIAVVGDGFLPVEDSGATFYTRAGDFTLQETGSGTGIYELVRPNGAKLMGTDGAGGALSVVQFTGLPTSFEISPDGVISATGATVNNAQLHVQRFANPDALWREADGMYRGTTAAGPATNTPEVPGTGGAGVLQQGALERSNVDMVTEFTEMIIAQRAFQANSKTVTTANEMLQEVVNLKR